MAAASRTRDRVSSPYDENYMTATATSFKDIIHSTPQPAIEVPREQISLHYDQYPSDYGSEGSAEMSIELGRGVKRNHENEDMSSNAVFSFANDNSQYEIIGTPPIRSRPNNRKSDGTLRKEASVRRATEAARPTDAMKRTASGSKQRAVSDYAQHPSVNEEQQEHSLQSATFQIRGSRFTNSRHVSTSYPNAPKRFTATEGLQAAHQIPLRPTGGNATVQSSANQSFLLPDLPEITELVSGVRRDGTPVFKRNPVSRSRFTSATYKPQTQTYMPVESLPIPQDEQAIWVSLHLLKEKVANLEMEKSELQKRSEEFEGEVIDLRSQLSVANRRPDSALGSDEDSIEVQNFQDERKRLQAKIKALQGRLDKSERKVNLTEISVNRITNEREAVVSQLGGAFFKNDELLKENESLREGHDALQAQNEDLLEELEELKNENRRLREKLARPKNTESQTRETRSTSRHRTAENGAEKRDVDHPVATGPGRNKSEGEIRSRKESRQTTKLRDETARRRANGDDIASRIEREVQKHRDAAAERLREDRGAKDQIQRSASLRSRSRSKSQHRSNTLQHDLVPPKQQASALVEATGTELTADRDVSRKSRRASNAVGDDLTLLSDIDDFEVANLRRKLEEERRSGRVHQYSEATMSGGLELTGRSATRQSLPRKSSLKDLTGGAVDGTGRISFHGETIDDLVKAAKTVRVQSPHSSQDIVEPTQQETDEGDISVLSNTSRRRRRASSTEGMTSAFIIPDITMHNTRFLTSTFGKTCIQHNASSCTVCHPEDKAVEIQIPIPVTEREGVADLTDATIRPSQPPSDALATVIKNMEDEIKHLKMEREKYNQAWTKHDPALSKRKRQQVKIKMDELATVIERKSNQVYALYDALEGLKQQNREMDEQEVEDTLQSIGIDPAELSGRVGRSAPETVDEMSGDESSEFLGLSDVESEDEVQGLGR